MKRPAVHKFEEEDYGTWQYGYLLCLDPDNAESDRKYEHTTDDKSVTCKHCLKKMKK